MEERRYTYAPGYENGSAARKIRPEFQSQETTHTKTATKPQQNCGFSVDFFSMALLVATIAVTLYMCISYLMIQSDITQLNKSISAIEKEITAVSKENDAVQAVLDNEIVDLEYIYETAVGSLGMVYPNNNEVVYYEYEDTGYFRQYQDIPQD